MAKQAKKDAPEIFGGNLLYREQGHYLIKKQQYDRAVSCFTKVMKTLSADDFRILLGLCKALLFSARHQEAAITADKCLHLKPRSYQAQHMKAETLFLLCEFDRSLIYAYRGMRKQRLLFKWGVYQCNETIEDCIGKNTSATALRYLLPFIRKLEEHRKILINKLNEEGDEFEGIDEDQSRFKDNDSSFQREITWNALNRILAKVYLNALFEDKHFMNQIIEWNDVNTSPNKKTTEELNQFVSNNYKIAIKHQSILREKRPFYCTLLQRFLIPKGHKTMIKKEKLLRTYNIIIEADFLLHRLHIDRMCKDYTNFFRNVDRIKDRLASYPIKIFPLKRKCLNVLYRMIAWAYIDARNLSCIYCDEDKIIYVKQQLGLRRVTSLSRKNDEIGLCRVPTKTAFRQFRRRLAMASESLELAWIFHEFCKFLIEIRQFDLARYYAKKARDMGNEAQNDLWVLNANHLLIIIEYNQNNKNEARDAVMVTLAGAKKLGIEYLVDFYSRSLDIVDEMDIEKTSGLDDIAIRQQLILKLMPEDMKPMVDFLWKNMETIPAKRRMSVMPGCQPVDNKSGKTSTRQTIMSVRDKDFGKEAKKVLLKSYTSSLKRPGFINFE